MANDPHTQIGLAIKDAQRRVAEQGVENADTKDVLLAAISWLYQGLRVAPAHNPGTKREIVIRLGTPAAIGGGVVALILAILEKLAG